MGRRSSCSLGDSESGYQAPPCYKLQTFLFLQLPNSKTNQPVKMAVSKIRQNYHEDCEALINKQINMEFYASYVYLSMSSFFNRDDQALHGFADHFKKDQTEVHEVILHALLEHRQLPCLANDEISPLDDDNGDEEGSVARVLEDLPVCVRPLLTVGVLQVVHSLRVPGPSETQQSARPEPILAHDHKVDKEAGAGLDHSNLT